MDITRAERLLLDRRRRGEDQAAAARRLGVGIVLYKDWERGRRRFPRRVALGKLRRWEELMLLRRRAGLTQGELASALGCTRRWVVLMESGRAPIRVLEEYWSE